MFQSWSSWSWKLGLTSLLAIGQALANGNYALAQIRPDSTLGAESSVVRPIRGLPIDRIDGGARRGANLFHSFLEFNVGAGRGAYFTNPVGVENIISRVTGSNVSNIFGRLGVLGNANLFLINPNGIIFGPNASLNVRGSFVASTASSLKFADGTEFSATAPQSSPLLTVSVPIGLQFGSNPGDILDQSQVASNNALVVQPGSTLALVGGNVSLDSGNLYAPGGRVELGGLAGAGTVGLNVDTSHLTLSFPDGVPRADVLLTNGSTVSIPGGGSSIAVNAHNLNISGGSNLTAGIAPGFGVPGSQAGNIAIDATGTVTIDGTSSTDLSSGSGIRNGLLGSGTAGNVLINTGTLKIIGNADISSITGGQGNAGSVIIRARDQVLISGDNSFVASGVAPSGVGNGSEINIQTRSLSLSNGGRVITATVGQGNAGNIQINASDSVFLGSGSRVEASTFGLGNAGNISVQAGGTVSLTGVGTDDVNSGISSVVGSSFLLPGGIAIGKGGNIDIKAGAISLTNGAELSANTYGRGDAGSVTISVSGPASFDGVGSNRLSSGAFSDVELGAVGKGGEVNVMAGSLSLTNGAELSTGTLGTGDAGSVTISVRGPVSFNGVGSNRLVSGAFSTVGSGAIGKGGEVNVIARSLSLTNSGRIAVSSFGQGQAGNLQIQTGTVTLDSKSSILAITANTEGGNIDLKAQDLLLLRHGSTISTTAGTAQAGGNGGNITITTPFVIAVPQENSDISANAFKGNGGSVAINASGIFGTQFQKQPTSESDITASSTGGGINGVVNINTPVINPSYGVATLPTIPINVNTLIANTCIASRNRKGGSFIVTGSGGLPTRPGDALVSPYPTDTVHSLPNNGVANASPETVTATPLSTSAAAAIVPATSWVFNNKGQVLLTAQASSTTLYIPWLTHTTCHAR